LGCFHDAELTFTSSRPVGTVGCQGRSLPRTSDSDQSSVSRHSVAELAAAPSWDASCTAHTTSRSWCRDGRPWAVHRGCTAWLSGLAGHTECAGYVKYEQFLTLGQDPPGRRQSIWRRSVSPRIGDGAAGSRLIGIVAWTEPSLMESGDLLPPTATTAEQRLRFLASAASSSGRSRGRSCLHPHAIQACPAVIVLLERCATVHKARCNAKPQVSMGM
jgi:hypothetical protein